MSVITTINDTDLISDGNEVINANFTNLNNGKIETSTLDTDTSLTANSDAKIATQKAIKTYVDIVGAVSPATTTTKGSVEIATDAQVIAGTNTGETGASLVATPGQILSNTARPTIIKTYTTSDTWTKPAGLKYIEVEGIGGGGGASGSTSASGGGSNGSSGSGGGAGGYSYRKLLVSQLGSTETITIGNGGNGGPAGAYGGEATTGGSNGTNTTFGSWLTAALGVAATASATAGTGGVATGGIYGYAGTNGNTGIDYGTGTPGTGGKGGGNYYYTAEEPLAAAGSGSLGVNAINPGCGGTAGGSGTNGGGGIGHAGGNGKSGLIRVTEYY